MGKDLTWFECSCCNVKSIFNQWSTFEVIWLLFSIALMTIASAIWKSSPYGYIASITGIICVVLVARGSIHNYWFGIINCVFYAYVAYDWKLYGEVMLNLFYFLPMNFVGLYIWGKTKNRITHVRVKVKFLSWINRCSLAIVCSTAIYYYMILLKYMEGNIPLIDSSSTVLSVIAMILMVKCYMEQWILWIIVDVASVIMWFIVVFKQGSNDIGLLIMWIAFLINAIYGCVNWIKMYKTQGAN